MSTIGKEPGIVPGNIDAHDDGEQFVLYEGASVLEASETGQYIRMWDPVDLTENR